MAGVSQLGGGTAFEYPAAVHDQDTIAKGRNQVQIVTDEYQAHGTRLDHVVEYREDLQLHRDIQRRCRLVGNDHGRFRNHHHGDHDALAHATGDFMWIGPINTLRIANAYRAQHLQRTLARGLTRDRVMHAEGFLDLRTDVHDRIQRVLRILHDHRDAATANRAHPLFTRAKQVDPVVLQPSRAPLASGGGQPEDGTTGLRFSRTRFTDNAEFFPAEFETDPIDCPYPTGRSRVFDVQVFDDE